MSSDPRTMTTNELVAAVHAADAAAFAAPWVAHTFEIDCPCPNGVHCGDSHTCEEVDAPEVYPHSHESPAEKGDGQCVVQISVPGLETFAKSNAALIALYRRAAPELARRLEEAEAALAEDRHHDPVWDRLNASALLRVASAVLVWAGRSPRRHGHDGEGGRKMSECEYCGVRLRAGVIPDLNPDCTVHTHAQCRDALRAQLNAAQREREEAIQHAARFEDLVVLVNAIAAEVGAEEISAYGGTRASSEEQAERDGAILRGVLNLAAEARGKALEQAGFAALKAVNERTCARRGGRRPWRRMKAD